MLNRNIAIITIGLIFLSVCGCKKSSPPKTIPVVVKGDLAAKTNLESVLKSNPVIVLPKTETKYSMQIVKPDPDIEYSILQVIPDPNIDYDIIIIDPATQQPSSKVDPELSKKLLELLKKKSKTPENKP